jgi:thiosulfate/3-mercaptopyruvate sulfurtransferase
MVKWLGDARPVTTDLPAYPPAVFTPRPRPELRKDAEQILAALGSDTLLLDARGAKEYRGEESRATRGGHIPGAVNVFYQSLLSPEDHTYASPDELRARFEAAGVDVANLGEREVVAYCNGGVSATPAALALEIASGRRVALYDGSWNEWGNDESKPIA